MKHVRMFVIILLVSAVATVYGKERHGTETGTAQLSIYKLPPLGGQSDARNTMRVGMVRKNIGPMWDGVIRFFPERVLPTTSQKLRETPSCERT